MNGINKPSSLDAVNYDPIDHLNLLFASTHSLSSISSVAQTISTHRNGLHRSISALEVAQAYETNSTLERMSNAQSELASVFLKINVVHNQAVQTEHNITSMTADIKRLDGTKKNLTRSMTALKRLQMLTTAYEQLRGLARTRQYRECAGLLQAVVQLMKHFNSYRSIDQIAKLSKGVAESQRELLEQICEDFEVAFAKDEISLRKAMLVEACLVMDALGDAARARLMTWYINTELREYRQVFRGSDEAGSLDNIGRRYAWFKRMMKTHEEHASIFPSHWRVGEALTTAFCEGTRDDFRGILEKSMRRMDGSKLDVNLLLSCLQETMDFEQGLEQRWTSDIRASIDTLNSVEDKPHGFNGLISVAFEPYLSLWVESQDRQLAEMVPKYRMQPLLQTDEEFSPQAVVQSAIELFHFYKLTLSQCAKLSTSERLLELSRIFAKYLDDYAQNVLLNVLQTNGSSVHDIILVLNTADFWNINATQLEESIRKRIDADFAEKVDLSSQADAFLGVASASVLALVRCVEAESQPAWREMRNTNWSTMDSVGDQSTYVGELVRQVNSKAKEILAVVFKTQYARAFCDNLIEHVASSFISSVVQCRPVSEVGAEQMLLDKYVLTKAFESLLAFHNPTDEPHVPPAGFVKRVTQAMGKIDPLLKTLQVRPSPPEALVQAYLIHIADRSDTNFRKILELKGVRKSDQGHLLELYAIHHDGPSTRDKLVQNSPLLTPLMNGSSLGSASLGIPGSAGNTVGTPSSGLMGASGSGAATGSGLQKFDAQSLGEKLLSAAREMGTGTSSGADKPGAGLEKATINENLKNFGMFFKRDIGSLGARFGKRDGSQPPGEDRR
ncbi:Vacuolar protein sorting-associated protein 53 [Ceratocystis fimbriata CBS 114723]|uniref:Vacuolar protein sorting-associated protein 53 n=1 Tax=Ceratocystis fimbriata CBS 114723 TaxID=1035309 RepID=A0A2C5WK16_9PEZI|nr:Vacuolar protein sorting-associated protein 53 [Ceratocystis fimbriata CBS 114723]